MTMETQEFVKKMEAIRSHYRTNSGKGIAFPAEKILGKSLEQVAQADLNELPLDSKKAIDDYQGNLVTLTGKQRDEITQEGETVKKDDEESLRKFKEKMKEQRDKAKLQSDKYIDEVYDKLVDEGVRNPAKQKVILDAATILNEFSEKVFTWLKDTIGQVIAKIVEWIGEVARKVRDAFTSVYDKVSGFFKGLFGAVAADSSDGAASQTYEDVSVSAVLGVSQ